MTWLDDGRVVAGRGGQTMTERHALALPGASHARKEQGHATGAQGGNHAVRAARRYDQLVAAAQQLVVQHGASVRVRDVQRVVARYYVSDHALARKHLALSVLFPYLS